MYKKVHLIKSCKILLLFLFVYAGVVHLAMGQVTLLEDNPLEIRFSKDQSQVTKSLVTLSLSDLTNYFYSEADADIPEWMEFNAEEVSAGNYYLTGNRQFISPGRVNPGDSSDDRFFALSLENGADFNISNLIVAFDFIYNTSLLHTNHSLALKYRVNENTWRNTDGGTIQTSSLGRSDEEWDTFSIQLNLNEIYLREGDIIELKWIFSDSESIDSQLPLALQRIEAYPTKSQQRSLERGSMIITEILPATQVDDLEFEYIEIYNPGDTPLPLKGMEIITSNDSRVIQQEIEIAPHSVIILSNVDISDMEGINNNYIYSGSMISSRGGRIELLYHGELVAGATFEAADPGVALVLDKAINAYDGYTSLQNLAPSETAFFPELSGTPGSLGGTVPFYKKTLDKAGWYFISPPGSFIERFNRHNSLEFFDLNGRNVSVDLLEPYKPVFVRKLDDKPLSLYVEDVIQHNRNEIETIAKQNLQFGAFPAPINTQLGNLTREGDESLAPVVKVWDERLQSFKITFTDQYDIKNWSPFLFNPSLGRNIGLSETRASNPSLILDRLITFSLFEGSSNNRKFADEAILGFLNTSANHSDLRYDLPKLTASFQNDERLNTQTSLYLSSTESSNPANAFVHLPYEIEESYQIGLGFEQVSVTGRDASIEWSIPGEIPDEWVFTLVDTYTNSEVNMREENSYRFRYNSQGSINNRSEEFAGLVHLQPSERNRFIINLEPYEALIEEEIVEERPGSVELRQNYPNPFNPSTNITFYLPEDRPVRVGIYNIVGQQVSLLIDDTMQAGEHSVIWDATNNPSGIYIVQLETGNRILTRKITLIK